MAIQNYYRDLTVETYSENDWSGAAYAAPSTVSGFIQPVSGNESFQAGKGGQAVIARLYTSISTVATYLDRVTQDSVDYLVLYGYQVKGVSGVSHHKEITLGAFQ